MDGTETNNSMGSPKEGTGAMLGIIIIIIIIAVGAFFFFKSKKNEMMTNTNKTPATKNTNTDTEATNLQKELSAQGDVSIDSDLKSIDGQFAK